MIGGFKNVHLAWTKKIVVFGFTWLFVYVEAFSYGEGVHIGPDYYMEFCVICKTTKKIFGCEYCEYICIY